MEMPKHNKPKEKIKKNRISLFQWVNSDGKGQEFDSFSLSKTVMKKNADDNSKFEGQVYSLSGLTKDDLEAIKEVITEMQEKLLIIGE